MPDYSCFMDKNLCPIPFLINDCNVRATFSIRNNNNPNTTMDTYKYKVHSAIYSWDTSNSSIRPTYNVTDIVQEILDDSNNKGIIPVNHNIFKDPVPEQPKSFAVIVSIVSPDGENTTRFCSCVDDNSLNVKDSGVICYF